MWRTFFFPISSPAVSQKVSWPPQKYIRLVWTASFQFVGPNKMVAPSMRTDFTAVWGFPFVLPFSSQIVTSHLKGFFLELGGLATEEDSPGALLILLAPRYCKGFHGVTWTILGGPPPHPCKLTMVLTANETLKARIPYMDSIIKTGSFPTGTFTHFISRVKSCSRNGRENSLSMLHYSYCKGSLGFSL